MFIDDNDYEYIDNIFIANEKVMSNLAFDPDDFVVDDTEEWYNQNETD